MSRHSRGFLVAETAVLIGAWTLVLLAVSSSMAGMDAKSRDVSRINDLKTLQSATEQYYQDFQVYPDTRDIASATGIVRYVRGIPRDPGLGADCLKYDLQTSPAHVPCGYAYNVSEDDNRIIQSAYELSTAFEYPANLASKASVDDNGGTSGFDYATDRATKDPSRLELGIQTKTGIDTRVTIGTGIIAAKCLDAGTKTANAQLRPYYGRMPVILCGQTR